jgi:hypothetical protein
MSDAIHIGSEVPAGTYRCTNCSYELELGAGKHLPPCPKCSGPQEWKATSGANDEPSVREQSGAETTDGNDDTSLLRGYDKRLEEWLGSLKDGAGQRSPEVLGGLAAKARDVADYLDNLAEGARSKMSSDSPRRSSDDDD